METSSEPVWTPSASRAAASRMEAFRHTVQARHDVVLPDSVALHAWSVEHLGEAWRAVWDDGGVVGDPGGVAYAPGSMSEARFFPDARLNVVETMLRGPADPSLPAILFQDERDGRRALSWEQLRHAVAVTAAALRAEGVGPGDRVAAWMPNLPETVVALLATWSLGAVFSSTSPDFGVGGVLDRFGQIEPVVLFAADGYRYGGQAFDCLGRLGDIAAGLPSVRRVVVVGHLSEHPRLPAIDSLVTFGDFIGPFSAAEPAVERFGFDHPGLILFSSGTTGPPKCIVHRAAGVVLKHLCEHQLHCDVKPEDRVFYFTTCGWMMWNWLVSALASRASIVLYDGHPMHPTPAALFDLVDRFGVTLLGVSAKYLDGARKAGLRPRESHRLVALRTVCSTGSPLAPSGFRYVYDDVKRDVHLASISGGTDLCGCFVAGDPTRPVWEGEIQGPGLGMAVDVFDEAGRPRPEGQGELVCTAPFPSVPLGFWGDDGTKFRAAYFERFPGVWAHGDFAAWTEHGGMVIYGRSDATLNAAGVRIGTSEIYRVVEHLDEVAEALAIGQAWEGDTRVVLFVRLAPGVTLTDELRAKIRARLREQASPRHLPARIVAVDDIPRTKSGKIVELAVTDVVHGRPVRNVEALANPEALEQFREVPDLAE